MKRKLIIYSLICLCFFQIITSCVHQNELVNLYYISSSCHVSEEIETAWEKQVSNLLGLEIDIHYICTSYHDQDQCSDYANHDETVCSEDSCSVSHSDSSNVFDFAAFKTLSELDGLVYIDDNNILEKFISLEFLSPVKTDKRTTNLFKALNYRENIPLTKWVLPLNYSKNPVLRSYSMELMDENDFKVPENIESLEELLRQIKNLQSKSNNKIFFSEYETQLVPYFFADIFRAYGVFPNGSSPISYNPLSGQSEDIVRDENFIKVLSFIKELHDENLIYNDSVLGVPSESSDLKFLSRYYYAYVDGYEENYYSRFLSGENDSYLIKENCKSYSIGILKNTQNSKYIAKAIISKINTTDDLMMTFSFGVENINYIDKGDYYKITDIGGDYFYPSIMTNYMFLEKPIGLDLASAEEWSAIVNDYKTYNKFFGNLLEDIEDKKFFIDNKHIDFNYSNETLLLLSEIYNDIYVDIFENNIAIDNAINTYIEKANKIIQH